MSDPVSTPQARDEGSRAPATAGALLRAARETAGLTVDAVAHQLRLAPRQVAALEEDDYTHLPGRTFVRGFVRNYARFVGLDPDTVVGALPGSATTPALAVPTLHQTAPTMGELPVTDHARPAVARWAIPLTLAAIVVVAGLYEWLRPAGEVKPAPSPSKASAPAPAERAVPAPAAPSSGTPLPNPLATAPTATPSGQTAATPAEGPVTASGAVAGPDGAQLVFSFRDYSWTEVRDREGRVLLSGMNPGKTSQTIVGAPPFDLVIGNAADVRVTYKGQPVDLAPHTRQNIARFTLQ